MAKKPFSYANVKQRVKNLRSTVAQRQKYKQVVAGNKAEERRMARQIMAAAGNALMHIASQGSATAGRVKRRRTKITGNGHRKRGTLKRNKRGQFVKRR